MPTHSPLEYCRTCGQHVPPGRRSESGVKANRARSEEQYRQDGELPGMWSTSDYLGGIEEQEFRCHHPLEK